jgi:type II secretory ATPase GspE/PulE/Tfp pilus assembly ATPase PilB-like protein
MTINDEIRDCINNGDDSAKIAKVAMRHGMRPLIEDGKEKVKEGVTTESEIAGVSFDSL